MTNSGSSSPFGIRMVIENFSDPILKQPTKKLSNNMTKYQDTINFLKSKSVSFEIDHDGFIQIGSIEVRNGESVTLDGVTQTRGIELHENASLSLPLVTQTGYINLYGNASLSLPLVTQTENINLYGNASLSLPLVTQTENINLHENASLSLPLVTQTGYINLHGNASLSLPLVTQTGYIYLYGNASLSLPLVTQTENINLHENASLSLPLVTQTRWIDLHENASLSLPLVTQTRRIDLHENASLSLPLVTQTENIYLYGNASLSLPLVTQTGWIYLHKNASLNIPNLKNCQKIIDHSEGVWFGHKIQVFDKIGCVVISEKTKGKYLIRKCRHSKFEDKKLVGGYFFIASKDGVNAHGETIQEAILDLQFKTGERDVSEFKNMDPLTVKTVSEWAFAYRQCTGACKTGIKIFIDSIENLKPSYTLIEIIENTKGQDGHEKFCEIVGVN